MRAHLIKRWFGHVRRVGPCRAAALAGALACLFLSLSACQPKGAFFTVRFSLNYPGASGAPASQSLPRGGLVVRPPRPVRPGWDFNGWYREAECLDQWDFPSDAVSADLTLYAKWTPAQGPAGIVLSTQFATRQGQYDYAICNDAPLGGTLFTIWARSCPMPDRNSRGNLTMYCLDSGFSAADAWSVVGLVCNGDLETETLWDFNANTMVWGAGHQLSTWAGLNGTYAGDYTFFNSQPEYTRDQFFGWVWTAIQIRRNEDDSFTLHQWVKVGSGPVFMLPKGRDGTDQHGEQWTIDYQDDVPIAVMRQYMTQVSGLDAGIASAWNPALNARRFTLGHLSGADPYAHYYLAFAKMYDWNSPVDPTLEFLESVAARTSPDEDAWGDWSLAWDAETGKSGFTDRSGHGHDLVANPGALFSAGPAFDAYE